MKTKKSNPKEINDKDISKISHSRIQTNSIHINGSRVFGKGWAQRTLIANMTLVLLMFMFVGNAFAAEPPTAWRNMTDGTIYDLDCSKTYTITETTSDNDENKYVRFRTADGCRIKVTLTSKSFQRDGGRWDRTYDYLYLNNGNTGTSTAGTRWYNDTQGTPVFASTGNEITIYFNNGTTGNSGFTITVECICPPENSTCIDFEDYASPNTSDMDNSGLPEGWSYATVGAEYLVPPHVYNGTYARDGNGVILTAGYYYSYDIAVMLPDIADIQRGGTLTFNAWMENTRYGILYVCYLYDNTINGIATITSTTYNNGNWSTGQQSVTIPADMPDGARLCFYWEVQASDLYSVVIDNICIPIEAATPHHLRYLCADGSTPSNIDPADVYAVAATVTNDVPNCSSNCFLGWSTTPNGNVVYQGGEPIDLRDNDVTLYAKYSGAATLSIEGCTEASPSDGYCYINACAGNTVNGGNSTTIRSSVSGLTSPVTYQWIVNDHVSDHPDTTTGTSQTSITIPTLAQMGYDVKLTVTGGDGCKLSKPVRVRVSKGVNPAGTVPTCFDDLADPPICVGEKDTIFIGEAGSSDFQIDEPSINIYATLGKGETTFIPDGECNGTNCYESSVTFDQFPEDATVTSADDIKFLRIKMEHSYIGDLQISLICPEDRASVVILPDSYGTTGGFTYDMPCRYIYIAGTGTIVGGPYNGYQLGVRYYIKYENGVYSIVPDYHDATDFCGGPSDADIYNAAIAQGGLTYAGTWTATLTGGQSVTVRFRELSNTYDRVNIAYSHGMGIANRSDGDDDHICDPASNAQGTGWDYCWSNSTVDGYTYATGNVWDVVNWQDGTTTDHVLIPSDMTAMSQIYHPYQTFEAFVGCKLNGTWKVKVCDAFQHDNGYVFDWSLGLSNSVMPSLWSFDVTLDERALSCSSVHYDGTSYPGGIIVQPEFGDLSSGDCDNPDAGGNCHLLFTDNYGCQTEISTVIKFAFDSAWVHRSKATNNGPLKQSYCFGTTSFSPITYVYGGKADDWSIEWKYNGAVLSTLSNRTSLASPVSLSHGFSVSTSAGDNPNSEVPPLTEKGKITISGIPTQPGIYSYTITANKCPSCTLCESKVIYDTITVYETPIVNAGTDIVNCTAGQSTTLTATATYTYGDVDIESWSWTPSTDLAAPTNASTVEAAPTTTRTYTVTATDEHGCSNSDQVQVTVNQLNATIEFGD